MCVYAERKHANQEQHWAKLNSKSLMPTEMTACLNPFKVNDELSKNVNENQSEPKILTWKGKKRTLICISSVAKLIFVPFLLKDA